MNLFESSLRNFVTLESMSQFCAQLDLDSEKFNQAWTKWHIDAADLATAETVFKLTGYSRRTLD